MSDDRPAADVVEYFREDLCEGRTSSRVGWADAVEHRVEHVVLIAGWSNQPRPTPRRSTVVDCADRYGTCRSTLARRGLEINGRKGALGQPVGSTRVWRIRRSADGTRA